MRDYFSKQVTYLSSKGIPYHLKVTQWTIILSKGYAKVYYSKLGNLCTYHGNMVR